MENKTALSLLAGLAQENRLMIFRFLVEKGPEGFPAGKIGDALRMTPSNLSFHLKELTHAGLLHVRHEGRFMIYSANFEAMTGLIAFLTENCCAGSPCELPETFGCGVTDSLPERGKR